MKNIKNFFFLFFCLGMLSCSSEDETLSKKDVIGLVLDKDPTAKLILPDADNPAVECTDYGTGCQTGVRAQIQNLKMIFVIYDTAENAKIAADYIEAYYRANWLFDDVAGEPKLEKFFKEVMKAKKGVRKKVINSK